MTIGYETREQFDEALDKLKAKTGADAVREALASRCFSMSEPYLSGWRLIIGFNTREEVDAVQEYVARLPMRDAFASPPSVSVPGVEREKAIRECAKIAEMYRVTTDSRPIRKDYEHLIGTNISIAILALIEQPGEQAGARRLASLKAAIEKGRAALASPPSVPGEMFAENAKKSEAAPPAVPVEREKIARALYEIQPLDDRLDENGDPIPWDGLASFCKELHYKQADDLDHLPHAMSRAIAASQSSVQRSAGCR